MKLTVDIKLLIWNVKPDVIRVSSILSYTSFLFLFFSFFFFSVEIFIHCLEEFPQEENGSYSEKQPNYRN